MTESPFLNQSLEFLHTIDGFQLASTNRVRATINLPLIIDDQLWKIYRINYGSVAVDNGEIQRAISFGEYVSTEGCRAGALVPQRPDDPSDEAVLLEDKLRRICLDLSSTIDLLANQKTRSSIARVIVKGLSQTDQITNELGGLDNAREIANAYAGLLAIGVEKCQLPTPSIELARYFGTGDLEWIGIHWPAEVIEEWKKSRFNPEQARVLAEDGINPLQLLNWLNYAAEPLNEVPTFEFIRMWSATEMDPGLCIEFSECGLNPIIAREAQTFSLSPPEAKIWHGIGVPFQFVNGWKASSIEIEEISKWVKSGCLRSEVAKSWIQAGLSSALYEKWSQVTTNSGKVAKCELLSISPKTLSLWNTNFWNSHPFELVLSWINEGVNPDIAYSWVRNNIPVSIGAKWARTSKSEILIFNGKEFDWARNGMDPTQSVGWKRLGVSLADATFANSHSVNYERFIEWNEYKFVPHQSLKRKIEWISLGCSINQVNAWLNARVNNATEAMQIISEGFSIETIHQYRIKQSEINERKAREARNERERNRLLKQQEAERKRLKKEHDNALLNTMMSKSSPIWLQEIQDRANYLQPHLRKVLGTKHSFEYRDYLSISVEMNDELITGTLEHRGSSTEVIFSATNFEPLSSVKTPIKRLTLGLAISWFIDCTIVLKKKESSGQIFRTKTADSTLKEQNGVKYVPTPSFLAAESFVKSGERVERVINFIYSVKGHIRDLADGHSPSEEARKRAPGFIRSRLKANQTYVRPHDRGAEESAINEYQIRLSKYSATANALGEL
jgi:hypothetical protein